MKSVNAHPVILVTVTAFSGDGRPVALMAVVDLGATVTGFRRSVFKGLGIDVEAATQHWNTLRAL